MKIKLPGFVLADLYKNSLVVTDDMIPAKPQLTTAAEPGLFLGNNNKHIAILVNETGNRYIDDESLQLLTNMLGALHLSLDDVAVVNISATPFTYKEIAEHLAARICLMFDVFDTADTASFPNA